MTVQRIALARSPHAAALGAALLSAATGVVLSRSNPSVNGVLVVVIGIACLAPLGLRVMQHRFDMFEPLVLASVALFVMFCLHPGALLAVESSLVFKGYNIAPHVRETLVVVLAAVLAFQLGYALPAGRSIAARVRRRADSPPDVLLAYGLLLLVVGAGLYAVFVVKSGGLSFLSQLLQGRTGADDSYFRASSAYLYGAPQLFVPASVLLVGAGLAARRRRIVVFALLAVSPLVLLEAARGTRSVLLPLVLAPATYFYLARDRRPRVFTIALVAYLGLTVGFAFLRESRVAVEGRDRSAELIGAVVHPEVATRALIVDGVDVDMFESIAVERTVIAQGLVQPSFVDFTRRLVAKPIPSVLWPGKPKEPDEFINKVAFPAETVRASNSTGPVGSFYYAGAIVGVVIGMIALGLLLRIPWEYWRIHPDSGFAQMVFAIAIAFTPVLFRAGVGDAVARSMFVVLPILMLPRLITRPVLTRPLATGGHG